MSVQDIPVQWHLAQKICIPHIMSDLEGFANYNQLFTQRTSRTVLVLQHLVGTQSIFYNKKMRGICTGRKGKE